MDLYKAAFLLGALICTVGGTDVDGYSKTEGASIISLRKRQYSVNTVAECATKCNTETSFTCKSFIYIEKDQECWTAESNSKTELILRRTSTALYEKNEFLLECVNGIGTDYRGTKAKTKSEKVCQRWQAKYPHRPKYTHPQADLESNFCRNPDGDSGGPWCYTTDSNTRWEHCNVTSCTEDCMHCSGEDYRGKTSTTENGFTCQRWDSQKPHNHGYNPSALPEKYLEENYCRNPDGDPRPWCFTTSQSKRWDFCSIPRCTSAAPTIAPELTCATGEGAAYRGTIAVTESGKACQSWSTQTPHKHNRTPENYPCKGLENNYCRNPDNERMPWCYTTDSDTRWEYCKVPQCGDAPGPGTALDCYEGNGSTYRGITSETISGKKCQAWNSMFPHNHNKTPRVFPTADLRRNLCRNPDGDRAPWCYTTDPRVRWEYCNLEKCNSGALRTTPRPAKPTQTPAERDCKVGNGATYRGPTSITLLGVTCQAWSAQSPHQHNSFTPQTHPTKGLDGNSCRNPDNDVNGPWCYTTDRNKKWDYCQIPDCAGLNCGSPVFKPKRCFGRIVGGCVSKPHSWPWQISLRTKSKRPAAYKVLLGIHTERATEPSKQERNLEKLVLGPNGADIALLKLERPALINDKVLPACLPDKDYIVPSGTECYVTGWGETQGTGGEGILKETGFPVIENKICNRPSYLNGRVKDHEMCAGNIEGGTDSCQGDSGGPLVCNAQNRFVLQGVTSWGLGCANAMKPGVYARVSKFVDWIDRTIKAN
uniref:Plasminogen n=1 Tax=Amphiprion ocellaris TaxID=80972 RepID=A0A3Q1ASI9_AMPOC